MEYIKSPLNYTGGKFKLLPQIIPLFPKQINVFIDLFGGGFNVGINVEAKVIAYNDLDNHIVELLQYFRRNDTEKLLQDIDELILKFELSKENRQGYNLIRDYYNEENNSPIVFYTLLCYAFNNQIRFNKDGKYNMSFGKDRSSFNPSSRKKFIEFVNELHKKDCMFFNVPFDRFRFDDLEQGDFVYCDPPYLNSTATYNEQRGWTKEDERALLANLDRLNQKHIKFALSNNLQYENSLLEEWKNKYNTHYLDGDYSNCSYHKKDKSKGCEILITNY